MAAPSHHYRAQVRWTGDRGEGTARHDAYSRDHEVRIDGKPVLAGSADPAFLGDPARHNPEDLFLAALSACHMLFYLGLCAREGLRVLAYQDDAQGWLDAGPGGGRFRELQLRPRVVLAPGADVARALALHRVAHARCFIANSCSAPVRCEPVFEQAIAEPQA